MKQKPNQENGRPWQVGYSGQGLKGEQGCPWLLALLHSHGAKSGLAHASGEEKLLLQLWSFPLQVPLHLLRLRPLA